MILFDSEIDKKWMKLLKSSDAAFPYRFVLLFALNVEILWERTLLRLGLKGRNTRSWEWWWENRIAPRLCSPGAWDENSRLGVSRFRLTRSHAMIMAGKIFTIPVWSRRIIIVVDRWRWQTRNRCPVTSRNFFRTERTIRWRNRKIWVHTAIASPVTRRILWIWPSWSFFHLLPCAIFGIMIVTMGMMVRMVVMGMMPSLVIVLVAITVIMIMAAMVNVMMAWHGIGSWY